MRKLTYLIAASIDGFIAGPDGGDPTDVLFPVEGDHMEDLTALYPEIIPTHVREALGIDPANIGFDTVLEGRHAYEIGIDAGISNAYRHLRHYVFSTSMAQIPDPTVDLVTDNAVEKVRELKAEQSGLGIWLCGGGTLAWTLRAEIDELVVKLNPVVAGSGIALFAGGFDPMRFQLHESKSYESGLIVASYRRSH